MSDEKFTVGELIRQLQRLDPNTPIFLPGDLTFNGISGNCDTCYIIEVDEPQADLTPDFVERNPHVHVAFIKAVGFQPGEIVSGPHDVSIY